MRGPEADRYRKYLLVAAIVMTVWGVLGAVDAGRFGRGGYVYSPTYVVEGIERGGAAEQAGLREGDRVITVGGIPVEDLPLYSRWPRGLAPRPGDVFPLVVEREGNTLAVEVVYRPPPASNTALRLGAALIGLSFMAFGLWALYTAGTQAALLLAWIGLAAGAATFGKGPYLGTWDGVAMHVQFLATILLSLLVLRFFITFPRPKRARACPGAGVSPEAVSLLRGPRIAPDPHVLFPGSCGARPHARDDDTQWIEGIGDGSHRGRATGSHCPEPAVHDWLGAFSGPRYSRVELLSAPHSCDSVFAGSGGSEACTLQG